MLPDYGVVIGQHLNYTTNQGQWMHVDLNITAGDLTYQAAVDVNEPGGLFQYQVFNNLDASCSPPSRDWYRRLYPGVKPATSFEHGDSNLPGRRAQTTQHAGRGREKNPGVDGPADAGLGQLRSPHSAWIRGHAGRRPVLLGCELGSPAVAVISA